MIAINFILVGLFITGLEFRCSAKVHGKKYWIFLLNTLFINLFALFALRFLLQKYNLLHNNTYTLSFSLKYLFFASIIGFVYLMFKYWLHHSAHLKTCSMPLNTKEKKHLVVDSFLFTLGGFLLLFGNSWSLIQTEGFARFFTIIGEPRLLVLLLVVAIFLSFLWAPIHIVNNYRTSMSNQRIRKLGEYLAIALFSISVVYTVIQLF